MDDKYHKYKVTQTKPKIPLQHGSTWYGLIGRSQDITVLHPWPRLSSPRTDSLQHGNKETIINRTENVYITLQCKNVCTPFKQCMAKANKCML
jgi:hypothetical protein